jgi:ribosomal protein S1
MNEPNLPSTLLFAMNIGQSSDSEASSPSTPSAETSANTQETAAATSAAATATIDKSAAGPLAAVIRGKGPLAARGLGAAKPASPAPKPASSKPNQPKTPSNRPAPAPAATGNESSTAEPAVETERSARDAKKKQGPKPPRLAGQSDDAANAKPLQPERQSKVPVPNVRLGLSDDLMAELERELEGADLDAFLGGNAGMANRKSELEDGQRVHGTVLKIHDDSVFVALGGPDEGVVALANFTAAEPKPGDAVEVIIRGINKADGLYVLTLPGEAVDVSEWDDIEDGAMVEVTITGANSGGLECKVGGIRGFIPISQISEHRIEDTSEFVDQRMICVVTESNPRRGNLVLSRRAVLEREREEKKKEQLDKIEVGDRMEGTVRSVKDFGAFVDLGGLEGLIHISKMSWDRIKHPSEVLEAGQKVQVKIDKIDKQTGKIGLSYRDLLENPWDAFASSVAVGTVMAGTVTRIANFGAFVRLAAGIEGLVHISEVASHRVSNVSSFVNEGQEVEVKVLSIDRDAQKISLSMKQAQHKAEEAKDEQEAEVEEPVREPIIKAQHTGPLRGGNDRPAGGERFGLRW